MTDVSRCPICDSSKFTPFLQCKDYTVSHETFSLRKCDNCGFLITNPAPDETQISQYYLSDSYISHTNKTKTLTDKLYVLARTLTLHWKVNIISTHTSTKESINLLDFGCGTGHFLKKCEQKNWQTTGVEPSDIARKQAASINKGTIHETIDQIQNTEFDAITLWHVLEHIRGLSDHLKIFSSKLSKTGTIFIAVPNRNSWDAGHYKTNWAAYDVPRHLWHFSKTDITKLVNKHGLHVVNIVPMKLDAFYISLLSEKYKNNGNQNPITFIKAFLNGIKSNTFAISNSEYSSLLYVVRK